MQIHLNVRTAQTILSFLLRFYKIRQRQPGIDVPLHIFDTYRLNRYLELNLKSNILEQF